MCMYVPCTYDCTFMLTLTGQYLRTNKLLIPGDHFLSKIYYLYQNDPSINKVHLFEKYYSFQTNLVNLVG